MLIDAKRGLDLGVPHDQAQVSVPEPAPAPGTAFPPRRLVLRGTPVFELNLWCGTCEALFTKLEQPTAPELGLAADRLAAGLDRVDDQVLDVYAKALPASRYSVLLLEFTPRLVQPGDAADYFTHEQVETWGVDPVTQQPNDPGTPYYRTSEQPPSAGVSSIGVPGSVFEFVVPMVPPSWNDPDRVAHYASQQPTADQAVGADPAADAGRAGQADPAGVAAKAAGVAAGSAGAPSGGASGDGGTPPTAVAYSLLDRLLPGIKLGEDYSEHWVLQHFLLDGHHKMEAAARSGSPVRLLALLDEDKSIAKPDDVGTLITLLS